MKGGEWKGGGRLTCDPPFCLSSCASKMPVGPQPKIKILLPTLGCIRSTPWAAQDAGSTSTASISVRLWIGKTLLAG